MKYVQDEIKKCDKTNIRISYETMNLNDAK